MSDKLQLVVTQRQTKVYRTLEAKLTHYPPIAFHDLRHTFGTRLADAGVEFVKIKELMGHSSIVTTMR